MSTWSYPVRVDATLAPQLSRWLWLVKWLLAVPHYVVLFFLWVAFLVLSVCALVAIVLTGRYPRGIFDFNVGVLRWSWRVAFYTYGGLGTDAYPPFTLEEVPDYPAHLEIAYPERLSRGLVLVKWWLLAIPHYLVLAFLLGGGRYVSEHPSTWQQPVVGGGLIGLLVLVAAVVLLFSGRYPQSLFDLVVGLNRWVLRVAGYVALMTDAYPPFRLDQGGSEPGDPGVPAPLDTPAGTLAGTPEGTPAPPPPGTAPTPPAPGAVGPRHWGAGRVVAVVVGVLVLLVGAGLLTAGATVGIAGRVLRDDQGFVMTPSVTVSSPRYAVVSGDVRLSGPSSAWPEQLLGTGKVRVEGGRGHPVFVGVGRSRDVAAYLAGSGFSDLVDPGGTGGPTYRDHPGGRPHPVPAAAGVWTRSAQGVGVQDLTWAVRRGSWAIVVMNADGSAGVAADVAVGATVPVLGGLTAGLLVGGGVLLVGSVVVLLLAVRRPAR